VATKTVRRNTTLKENGDEISVVSIPTEATTEHLTYVQPARHRRKDLDRIVWRVSRTVLGAFRAVAKGAVRDPSNRPAAGWASVLPADWEYLTNVSAKAQPDFWAQRLVGEAYGRDHKRN
jgi:hypothetical protein